MSAHTQIRATAGPTAKASDGQAGLLQRKCACGGKPGLSGACEECGRERLLVQRKRGRGAEPDGLPSVVRDVVESGGRPLDAATRETMESRLGHDFGRVRVHADARAAESARAVNALAYTVGSHIVFDSARYAPGTREGQKLIAHELAHVVQQSRGASQETAGHADGSLERDAERAEDAFARGDGGPVNVRGSGAPALARKGNGKGEEEAKQPTEHVEVIPDKQAGKLRVVLLGPGGKILAGLAEITPAKGAPLDPNSVTTYTQYDSGKRFPHVRVQTPSNWGATIDRKQNVAVKASDELELGMNVTAVSAEETEELRKDYKAYVEQTFRYEPGLAKIVLDGHDRANGVELKKMAEGDPGFQEWQAKRAIWAQNRAYQQQLGLPGVTPAQAREIVEDYEGYKPRTRWEMQRKANGSLDHMIRLRDPRTGVVVAYLDRKLRGVGREFYGEESKVYSIHGKELRSTGLPIKAVYGPHDYLLDPLGIQELIGVAESDTTMGVVADVATAGVTLGVKGAAKGVKGLAKLGRKGAAEGVETVARVGERELAQESAAGVKNLVVHADEVAQAASHQAAKLEGDAAGRLARGTEGAVSAEARAAVGDAKLLTTEGRALKAEGREVAGGASAVKSSDPIPQGKQIVAERHHAGHDYKVLADGTIVRCTDCGELAHRLADLEKAQPKLKGLDDLKRELTEIQGLTDAVEKAKRSAIFGERLDEKFLPAITAAPHQAGYARQVEKRFLKESQQYWEKFGKGSKESPAVFARHEQDFNSLGKTLENKRTALEKAGQPTLLPEVKTDVLNMPVDHFITQQGSPDLRQAWRELKELSRADPDLAQRLSREFGVGSQGRGAGLVGSRRPDIVEFFLDRGEIVVTDITTDVVGKVHMFKSKFYREVIENMVGPGGPKVYGVDIHPLKPLGSVIHD